MPNSLTLYQIESDLAALLDTEDLVPEEARAEFAAALASKASEALDKRDNVIRAIAATKATIEACKAEEERIREHRKRLESGLERFTEYVAGVVAEHGEQKAGQVSKTLRAGIGVLRAQRNPGGVVIEDASKVPLRFCRAVVRIEDADEWARLYTAAGENCLTSGAWRASFEPDKDRIGDALDNGEVVPGADKKFGEWSLRLK